MKENSIEKTLENIQNVDLITLLRKFKKEGVENFIVIRRNDFDEILSDYKDKLNYFYTEYDRATETNCLGSIYEQSGKIKGLISRAKRIERNEFKWFMNITQRDKPEFIDAIRTYLREPEYRI